MDGGHSLKWVEWLPWIGLQGDGWDHMSGHPKTAIPSASTRLQDVLTLILFSFLLSCLTLPEFSISMQCLDCPFIWASSSDIAKKGQTSIPLQEQNMGSEVWRPLANSKLLAWIEWQLKNCKEVSNPGSMRKEGDVARMNMTHSAMLAFPDCCLWHLKQL